MSQGAGQPQDDRDRGGRQRNHAFPYVPNNKLGTIPGQRNRQPRQRNHTFPSVPRGGTLGTTPGQPQALAGPSLPHNSLCPKGRDARDNPGTTPGQRNRRPRQKNHTFPYVPRGGTTPGQPRDNPRTSGRQRNHAFPYVPRDNRGTTPGRPTGPGHRDRV